MSLPTNQEQEMLERINRLRADPGGEFARLIVNAATRTGVTADITGALQFFNVDLTLFAQQMAAFSAVAPLAWSNALEDAAAFHSAQMIATDTQSHQVPGEPGLLQRTANAGYTGPSTLGENIFAYTESVIYGHAGFVIDWGFGPGGMQSPAGHRNSLMSANFTEIGIDITAEANPATDVGPLVVTQDLGNRFAYVPQVLGVVFGDGDSDGFYDAGEGRGGVTVTLSGTPGTFNTTTWSSGGYQIAVPQGTYTLTFSGGGLVTPRTAQATLGATNVKVDLNTALEGPPSVPSAPDLAAGSDSGASSTDNRTNVTTPVFTGTGDSGATITLFAGATQIGSGVVAVNGTWSITASSLGTGAHAITAKATNGTGTSAASSALVITIDTAAPAPPVVPDLSTVSDSGTSSSDNVTKITTPTFTGTAEAKATVSLRDGVTVVGTGQANDAGVWSIKTTALSQGAHQISAVATDVAGNTGAASAALTVTIDTAGPEAPTVPNLISASDTGRSSGDNITQVTTPTFGGLGEAGGTITLFSQGVARGSAKVNGGGGWSVTSSALSEGTFNMSARVTDAAGNIGTLSAALTVTIDLTAPPAPVVSLADTTRVSGSSEASAEVTLFANGVAVGSAIADAGGAWSVAVALAAGSHALTASATDKAGNTGALSASVMARIGTGGADVLAGGPGIDLMGGGAGDDDYHVNNAGDVVTETGANGTDTIFASVGYALDAKTRIEFLRAEAGAPGLALTGNGLANTIEGGDGGDTLAGLGGADTLFGGLGADVFAYLALTDSTAAKRDLIGDFSLAEGDRIGLSALDANACLAGDQAFSFIGAAAFSSTAGELRAMVGGGFTTVSADATGDGVADFVLRLTGAHTLGAGNFVL